MTASILTIDDSASLRMAIRIAQAGAGYGVTGAGHGVEGLVRATETRFDLISAGASGRRRGDAVIGLATDSVDEVATLDAADCGDPPTVGMMRRPREPVPGVVRRGQGIVVLPDLDRIFHDSISLHGEPILRSNTGSRPCV